MAAGLRGAPVPETPDELKAETPAPSVLTAPAHAYLSRLAALHDEAAETAHLANFLGRAPWIIGILGLSALGTALLSSQSVSTSSLVVWLVLVGMSVAAIAHAYGQAIKAPFDQGALKGFARSLSAALLYAGAAWGAGLLLATPSDMGLESVILYALAPAAILAIILKARDVALCFVVPATLMSAFCVLMRGANASAVLGILAGGLIVAAASSLLERFTTPQLRVLHG